MGSMITAMTETPFELIWLLEQLEIYPDEYSDYNERRTVHSLFYLADKFGFLCPFSFVEGIEGPLSGEAAEFIPYTANYRIVWAEWDLSNAHEIWPKLQSVILAPGGVNQKVWIRLLGDYVFAYEALGLGKQECLERIEATFPDLSDDVKNRLKTSLFYIKVQA